MKDEILKANSREYFDNVAKTGFVIDEPARCYEAMLKIMPDSPGRIIDIGCGTGEMLRKLHDKYSGSADLYGIDLSRESIKIARMNCPADVSLSVCDVDDMDFEEGFFDIIICMHSFHHYPDPLGSLKKMKNILKDDGILFMVENDHSFLRRLAANITYFIYRHHQGDVKMYSKKQMAAMMGRAGFETRLHEHIGKNSQLLVCRKEAPCSL